VEAAAGNAGRPATGGAIFAGAFSSGESSMIATVELVSDSASTTGAKTSTVMKLVSVCVQRQRCCVCHVMFTTDSME
jgi:hypothetical protein